MNNQKVCVFFRRGYSARMIRRIIETEDDVAEGAEWLATRDPRFARAYELTGPLPLRRRGQGFTELLRAIVGQQVSIAAAQAIWGRMEVAGVLDPVKILATSDEDMRAVGLSRQKIKYARALADAGVDYGALAQMPDQDVIKRLVQISGIGPWTAEIYAMFSLGRADVFAHGDLALQESARMLLGLPDRPREKAMREIAADWSPWRAVAARLLWAYYRVEKDREGIL